MRRGRLRKFRPTGSWTRRLADCCCSPRTIRNCARANSSCACRMSWREPKIASAWRANATTTRSRTTTRSCCNSPTASGRALPGSNKTMHSSRPARPHRPCLPSSSEGTLEQRNAKGPSRAAGWPFCMVGDRGPAGSGLFEGSDGACLVVLDVEDGVELGQLEQVMNFLGQVQELDIRALVLGCRKGDHQLA